MLGRGSFRALVCLAEAVATPSHDILVCACRQLAPYSLERKYPQSSKEWRWQHLFPARQIEDPFPLPTANISLSWRFSACHGWAEIPGKPWEMWANYDWYLERTLPVCNDNRSEVGASFSRRRRIGPAPLARRQSQWHGSSLWVALCRLQEKARLAGNETVPALATVYAREDYGVLVVGTRWEPHRVFCTQRPRGRRGAGYVVKYRRSDAESAAALISEVVCYGLLRRLGVRTLSAVLVEVTPAFIRASMRQGLLEYEIEAGLHFGTVFRSDVDALNPEVWQPSFWGELAEPEELVAIWAADSWLMNLDRGVYGNLLREQNPEGKWHLIAADQSDCFLGAGALADGTCFARSRHHGPAAYLPLLERTLLTQGTRPLQEMVERIRATVPSLPAAAVLVPEEWWRQAGVSAAAVIDCLGERAARIDRIVEAEKWKDYHMSQKADDCSGYSGAALRYLVDAAREVTMPVGVLLWSRASQQIWFRLPREGERVEGVHLAAAQPFLVAAQEKIEGWHRLGRLPYAKAPLEPLSVAWWEQVRGLLQWSVHLGPVHSLAGGDPEAELEALYQRTVEPQPAGRERLRRLEAAVERALGPALSERFQRHPTVPGFGGRPVPVLRQAADDRRAVIVEAVNLAAATAEKEADALASRLASIRKGESEGEIRFVLGYLAPAKERAGERALRAWIEHVSGAALFDLQEEAEAFHAAAAASLAELKEPLERDEVARVTATRARPRPAVRRGSRKSTARPRS